MIKCSMSLAALIVLCIGSFGSYKINENSAFSISSSYHTAAVHPLMDSARAEVDAGRYWHASRLLRSLSEKGEHFDSSAILLLARADAGWKNWSGVIKGLERVDWLDKLMDAEGRRLLALGFNETENWKSALENFTRLRKVRSMSGTMVPEASREARVAARAGEWASVFEVMKIIDSESPEIVAWTALDIARWSSKEGDVEHVLDLLPWIQKDITVADLAWELKPQSFLMAGDSSRALDAYRETIKFETDVSRRGQVLSMIGALRLARGDSVGARKSLEESLNLYPHGLSGARAARTLLDMGELDPDLLLIIGQILDNTGDSKNSLKAYLLYKNILSDSLTLNPEMKLTIARLMSSVGQHDAAISSFRKLVKTDDSDFEIRVLNEWLRTRRNQGRYDAVRTIQRWIIERFPESSQAVSIVISRAAAAQDRGSYSDAAAGFERAITMAPSLSFTSHAWMRLGQIYLQRKDMVAASQLFQKYLTDFPDGQQWEQAAYWSAVSLSALGREVEAKRYLDMVHKRNPTSYYAVLAWEHIGKPYNLLLSVGSKPNPPKWLMESLITLDILVLAGLDRSAEFVAKNLIARANGSIPVSLDIADNLIERGFTIEGINVGWKLLREGAPYSLRLMRVLYPFPHRQIVTREAKEAGIDPLFIASLIRQESAFAVKIRSSAGAIGLMQVMPATGSYVADKLGIKGFTPASLETAEINLHLGMAFWVDMERRYGENNLPLALSAYNAGPTRARRWKQFEESGDPLRFTERIPFDETRGYVKNITRNIHLYKFLYRDN